MSLVIANPKRRVSVDPFEMLIRDFFPGQVVSKDNPGNVKSNVIELDDQFELEIAAPGYQKEDFSIAVEDNQLVISAKIEHLEDKKEANYRQRQFEVSSFSRTFKLDEKINQELISANFENGILKITLPKKEEAKVQPKKLIEVS
jgi:HSP20 family protein